MNDNDKITRRDLLRKAGAFSAALAFGSEIGALASSKSEQREKPMHRPNILFAIADDWSWPHAGVYGDQTVKTPAFDRVAREGVLFTHSFCAAPTCTASRAATLTGQAAHRLGEGANLTSVWPAKYRVYPDVLEEAGYFVGYTGKGWAPGVWDDGGWKHNPAGNIYDSFEEFISKKPADKPFCFWYGSFRPHRNYVKGQGSKAGLKAESVNVPAYLPDTPEVRSDMLDYYEAVQQYDAQVAELLDTLEKEKLADNTLLVVTSDNGLPFPRAKANLYDAGTRMPLAIRWPAMIKKHRVVDELVDHTDFAPTFLEAAGLKPLPEMTGKSLMDILSEKHEHDRKAVFFERERHTDTRPEHKSYPMRAARTNKYLYIRNPRPNLWPASGPTSFKGTDLQGGRYADIDAGPTKWLIVDNQSDPKLAPFFELACAKRPEEELFDIKSDPCQLKNLASDPAYAEAKRDMRAMLDKWMTDTLDPRAKGETDFWDKAVYQPQRKK